MRRNTLLAALAAFLVSSVALAAEAPKYPATVAGSWKIDGNGFEGTLALTQAAGTTLCRTVAGTIYGSDAVKGIYCPATGRLVFGRNPGGTTIQLWEAVLSRTTTGAVMMSGSFAAVAAIGGTPGEYSFWGVRQ
jgi:hypothetical protein